MTEVTADIVAAGVAKLLNEGFNEDVWAFVPPDDEAQERWDMEQEYRQEVVPGSDHTPEDLAGRAMYDVLIDRYKMLDRTPTVYQMIDKSIPGEDQAREYDYLYVFPPMGDHRGWSAVLLGETYVTIYAGYGEMRKVFEWGDFGISYQVYY